MGLAMGRRMVARMTRVVRMAGDSPAERAGMQQGDIIRTIGGTDVRSAADVTALLDGERYPLGPGDVYVCRSGHTHGIENGDAPLRMIVVCTRA